MGQKIQPLARLAWSDDLCTGIGAIDEQHRRLISIFNKIASLHPQEANTAVQTQSLLRELVEYTHYHFRTEAELMRTWPIDASRCALHLQAHRRFIEFLDRANALAATSPADVTDHLLAFLAQWIMHHIMDVDMRMAREIRALQSGIKASPEAPKTQTTHDILIDSVSSLNDSLVQRTFEVLDLNRQLQVEKENLQKSMDHQKRLTEFNAILGGIHQIIAGTDDEKCILQAFCDLAIQHTHFCLVWVGRPDENGYFQVLAAAGAAVAYLEDIKISSRPGIPEGVGRSGRAWRRGKAIYSSFLPEIANTMPWAQRTAQFGIASSATIPIFRDGAIWAILNVYHTEENIFDAEIQSLLEEIARDIGFGLARIDLVYRNKSINDLKENLLNGTIASIFLVRYPESVIVQANHGFLHLFGYSQAESVVGHGIREVFHDANIFHQVDSLSREIINCGQGELRNIPIRQTDGTKIYADFFGQRLEQEETSHTIVIWTVIDVTERHRLSERLERQAFYDFLTGLPNRRLLESRLEQAMARAHRAERLLVVCLLDLDEFKPINDNHGHEAGDEVLVALGQRLLTSLRKTDFVARWGGDEFVLLIEGLTDLNSLDEVLSKVGQAVTSPIPISSGRNVQVGVSMGVSIYPFDGKESGVLLLRNADHALYESKSHKADRKRFWILFAEP